MLQSMQSSIIRHFWLLCLVLQMFPQANCVHADIAQGIAWLKAQQQPDESYTTPTTLTTPFQSTAAVLATLRIVGAESTSQPAAYLLAPRLLPTEYLARRLLARVDTAASRHELWQTLLTHRNTDGGFGDLPGFHSTILDTAWTLIALADMEPNHSDVTAQAAHFLLARQEDNGGWADGANTPSVPLSALALHALWHYRHVFAVGEALEHAQAFLLARRVQGTWPESFVSALALLAVFPRLADVRAVEVALTALRSAQEADGSWGQDVYTTALALRVLALAEQPVLDPDRGTLRGRIVDGESGFALAGFPIELTGMATITAVTAIDGFFQFVGLAAGDYQMAIRSAPFAPLTMVTALPVGGTVDLGTLTMLALPHSTVGTVRGVLTDAQSALPLAGVHIRANGISALSGVDGRYQINQVPPGLLTLTAERPGYLPVSGSGTLAAGGHLIFSPRLIPTTSGPPATAALFGTVTAASTGAPLTGVTITVSGSTVATTATDSSGAYRLAPLHSGPLVIEAYLPGYDLVRTSTTVNALAQITFSPRLYSSTTTPPGANASQLGGIVLDARTNTPLANASIEATYGGTTTLVTTGADGRFLLHGLTSAEVRLHVSREGYTPSAFVVPLEPLAVLDIGQVRLRPDGVDALLPDLTLTSVVPITTYSDPHPMTVTGTVDVTVQNQGTTSTTTAFTLLAFYDIDKDGSFEPTLDTFLGTVVVSPPLLPGGETTVALPVSGSLPFRDAPITVWADSQRQVLESAEANNFRSTAEACTIAPAVGTLDPVLKWAWTGSPVLPGYNQVMSLPLVVPLQDTNGDGQVDQQDVPAVVFHTFHQSGHFQGDGVLRAVDGRDGRELWSVTNPAYRTRPEGSLAAADVDRDGRIDILAPGQAGGVIAFDASGQVKWVSPWPDYARAYSIAVADLDGDGAPEIVVGNTVLRADGTLRWQGSGPAGRNGRITTTGPLSIVADIDLDGRAEVLAGAAAYRDTGELLWHNAIINDGFVAVGNFNATPQPEIVIVSGGRVFLLDAQGAIVWGPVLLPGGGNGGSPTIADMTGDGQPEIGVAGARTYTVFTADGSILWSVPTQDASSNITGSSVFDFEGDGQAEVVYADEFFLRIYRGRDGATLFATPNSSGTIHELPVLADIDADDHADLVVVANDYAWGSQRGVRVFSGRDNIWVNTRRLWNQHSYHITNIHDDGSVPTQEEPSWLTHNTYRLNTFVDRDARASADLTIAALAILDQGTGQSLRVRVGNGGALTPSQPVMIAFYQGDPEHGGILLGRITVAELEGDRFQDVQLDGVVLPGTADVYAIVDPDNLVQECHETNNLLSTSLTSAAVMGQLTVSTDAVAYGPASTVNVTAAVTNPGSLPAVYTVHLQIVDAAALSVVTLPPLTVPTLQGGQSISLPTTWNTGHTLTGTYTLVGTLVDGHGNLLHEGRLPLSIMPDTDVRSTLRLTTDRPTYHTSDTVTIAALVRNVTRNALLQGTSVELAIDDPVAHNLFTTTLPLGDLGALSQHEVRTQYLLRTSLQGTYTITARVRDAEATLLATAQTSFHVTENLSLLLSGQVTSAHARLPVGTPQQCTGTVTNHATTALTAVKVRQQLFPLVATNALHEAGQILSIANGDSSTFPFAFATATMPPGDYACVLQAELGGSWHTLGAAIFTLQALLAQLESAYAGADQSVFLGDTVTVHGHAVGTPPPEPAGLAFTWQLIQQPAESTLIQSDITGGTTANAAFTPDVRGDYLLRLTIRDGTHSVSDDVLIQVRNTPPIADAGLSRHVETATLVTLDGSNSFDADGDLITYAWSLEWSPQAVPENSILSDADLLQRTSPMPAFTPDVDGIYRAQLIVHDGWEASAPAVVTITASKPNIPPQASAGMDRNALVGDVVVLDGGESDDPDQGPAPLSYLWSFVTIPTTSHLSADDLINAAQSQAHFTPDVPGQYQLALHVDDGQASARDEVMIDVSADNVAPNAQAGADQTVFLGTAVLLDGSGSADPDHNPQALAFTWRFVSVAPGSVLSNADLRNAQSAMAQFTPDVAGSYVLELLVSDGAATVFDHVMIQAEEQELEAVSDLRAYTKNRQIRLRWSPVIRVTSYTLWRRVSGGAWSVLVEGYHTTIAAYTDSGLTNHVMYCYYVVAVDHSGNVSAASNEVCAIPVAR